MRLFGYYALHSFKNQLKKLFKSWVIIFILACALIGGLIGFGMGKLSDAAQEIQPPPAEETVLPESPVEPPNIDPKESAGIFELAIGGAVLLILVINALRADKSGSAIFLPADVPLLFASPLKPQSVLMFRLMTQIGTAILGSVYLLFQLPNLMLRLGLNLWAALAVIAAWVLTVVFSRLLQVLLYTFGSNHPGFRKNLRFGVFGALALVALGFLLFWRVSGEEPFPAALRFFNAPAARLIPIWGWIKGFCIHAAAGETLPALLYLAALLAGGALFVWMIWRIKADFYEDAMAKSEETAELLRNAQESRTGVAVRRKKDRGENLRRDGMNHGFGANVFFFKSLYNRFRFAHLRYFTKTAETYLFAAVALSILLRFVVHTRTLIPVVLALGVLAFFRALGNPLAQDTKMDYFVMIPESAWAKMFWSLLGGTVNCLLDLFPALLAAVLILGAEPLPALAWMLFIASVDLYATIVGAFLDLAFPRSTGKTVKQLIQILFLYFGLIPDAGILAAGIMFSKVTLAAAGATVLNVLLGTIFFLFTPSFLTPKGGKAPMKTEAYEPTDAPYDPTQTKGVFSRIGFSVSAIWVIWLALTTAVTYACNRWFPGWDRNSWTYFACAEIPLYLCAMPIGVLLMRKVERVRPAEHRLPSRLFVVYFLICQFLVTVGNLVGLAVNSVIEKLVGTTQENPVAMLVDSTSLLPRLVFLVILAPMMEEFIFRRQLIDRMRPYGEKLAIILSAAMFALFHGNVSQAFYAFVIGLVFGYLYVRAGKLRYTIMLHMLVNFLGGVVAPYIQEKTGLLTASVNYAELAEELGGDPAAMVPLLLYSLLMIGMVIAGMVLLLTRWRKVTFLPAERQIPAGCRFRTAVLNPGMILFFLLSAVMFVIRILP